MKPRIGALILAAGESRRFAADKRMALLTDNRTLLQATVDVYRANMGTLRIVLRSGEEPLGKELAASLGLVASAIDYSVNAARGMGHTIADAISSIDWDLTFIALADMPFIRPDTLRILHRQAQAIVSGPCANRHILLPMHKRLPGHPVGFTRGFYPELSRLQGDRGARAIIADNSLLSTRVPLDDPGVLKDIDNRADWLEARMHE